MVDIFPFRALRYNTEKIGDLSSVTAPPYDVIEKTDQERLYEQSPHNIVRLILGEKKPEDTDTHNVYTRARDTLKSWQQESILIQEARPAIYAYSQTFEGTERKGMIALLKIEDYATRQVLPHEKTIAKYISDRFQLSQTTGANLSQIFMIYSDPQRTVERMLFEETDDQQTPWMNATDYDGVVHRFRPVSDPDTLGSVQQLFQHKNLLIADGHHRYQTALTIRRLAREVYRDLHGKNAPEGSLLTDYMMVFLSNMDDPGLLVYPTHRILKSWPQGWNQQRFEAALQQHFDIVEENQFSTDEPTLIYCGPRNQPRWVLKHKEKTMPKSVHPELAKLDVTVLDKIVIEGMLNNTAQNLKENKTLWFDRSDESVENLIKSGELACAFLTHAPSVHQVKTICEAGELMPQKSTYFYPKILSGTVLYSYLQSQKSETHALSDVIENAIALDPEFLSQLNLAAV